jgi:hypothetical protein
MLLSKGFPIFLLLWHFFQGELGLLMSKILLLSKNFQKPMMAPFPLPSQSQ